MFNLIYYVSIMLYIMLLKTEKVIVYYACNDYEHTINYNYKLKKK